MAVDLEAIRRKVQELNGQRRMSNVQLWKPGPGKYRVRGIPWKSTQVSDGMPFVERRFYYLGDNPRILAPSQFGKPDPVNDLIRKLHSSKSPDDRELAKKLYPKLTAYMAVRVHGEEAKGVQVWSFNKFVYNRLLGFYTDEGVNPDLVDFLDPRVGIELLVEVKPSGKKFNGKDVMDTVVDLGRKSGPIDPDPATVQKLLDSVPNIDDMYPQKSAAEIEKILNDWLAGGSTADAGAEGSSRGNKSQDELDKLVSEVKAETKQASKPAPEEAKPRKAAPAKKADLDEDMPSGKKQSLDDAFNELMEGDDA